MKPREKMDRENMNGEEASSQTFDLILWTKNQ